MSGKNVNQKIRQNISKASKTTQSVKITEKKKEPSAFAKHLPWVLVIILFLLLSLIYFPVAIKEKHLRHQT